jgi:hypothetical protein
MIQFFVQHPESQKNLTIDDYLDARKSAKKLSLPVQSSTRKPETASNKASKLSESLGSVVQRVEIPPNSSGKACGNRKEKRTQYPNKPTTLLES